MVGVLLNGYGTHIYYVRVLYPLVQEVFHVYLNKIENDVNHLFLVMFGNT